MSEREQWLAVASAVLAGDYDETSMSKTRRVSKRRPPQGSLATALVIGLRQFKDEPVVQQALDHINDPT